MTDIHDPCRANMEKADRALRAALNEIERHMREKVALAALVSKEREDNERLRAALEYIEQNSAEPEIAGYAGRALEPKP